MTRARQGCPTWNCDLPALFVIRSSVLLADNNSINDMPLVLSGRIKHDKQICNGWPMRVYPPRLVTTQMVRLVGWAENFQNLCLTHSGVSSCSVLCENGIVKSHHDAKAPRSRIAKTRQPMILTSWKSCGLCQLRPKLCDPAHGTRGLQPGHDDGRVSCSALILHIVNQLQSKLSEEMPATRGNSPPDL